MKNKRENFVTYEEFKSEPIVEGFGLGGYIGDAQSPFITALMTTSTIRDVVDDTEDLIKTGTISIPSMIMSIIGRFLGAASYVLKGFMMLLNQLGQIALAGLIISTITFFSITIAALIKGKTNWLRGLNTHLKCAEDELNQGGKNSLRVYRILTSCTWEKFLNFMNGSCSRYYLVDIIWGIFYGICIELPIVLIKAIFGIDLHIFVEILYNLVVIPLDTIFFALSGYHLIAWSDDVIKKCYKCKGTWTLSNGQEVTMYKTFDEWGKMLDCGAEQLANGFMRAFTTILPTEKWLTWADDDGGKKYSTINSDKYGNPNPNFWKPTVLGY